LLVHLKDPADVLALGVSHAKQARSALALTPGSPPFGTGTLATNMKSRGPEFTPMALRTILKTALYYAVPMRKRTQGGKADAHRLSVGRALNNDIVLRSEDVSKFHAWFEMDEDGVYFVTDSQSKNRTRVNGRDLEPQWAERLCAGDRIQFGGIETIFCPAWMLWEAMSRR
jgi:hypothetical protein